MTGSLQIPRIAFRVSDLARSRDFYTRHVGFSVVHAQPERLDLAVMPDGPPLFTLHSAPSATPSLHDSAGLFHAALLLPSRSALASWLAFAAAQHLEFEGFSDHGVSDAIYFSDPDGNGLEFYSDRPRETWPYVRGELAMTTRPLDTRELLTHATPTTTPLTDAHWGHVHLRVTDLERSENFYRNTLPLAVTQRSYPGARFLAADGYHHHLGLNVWGNPRRPHSAGATGLLRVTFALRHLAAPATLVDPDGIPLELAPL